MGTKQSINNTNFALLCNRPSLHPFLRERGGWGQGARVYFRLRFRPFNGTNKESEFSGQQIIFSLEFAGNLLIYCLGF